MKALIFQNKVVDLVEKEFPVSPEMTFVDCDDTVKFGYDYTNGEFIKPKPLLSAEEYLRKERNKKLVKTDWEMLKGLEIGEDMTALKKYRQDLRDLPASAKPKLDENNNSLTNVTWPSKPE